MGVYRRGILFVSLLTQEARSVFSWWHPLRVPSGGFIFRQIKLPAMQPDQREGKC